MFNDNRLVKLKVSLTDTIEKWIEECASEGDGRDALNTYFSDYTAELMSDAAFTILLAQSDLTDYLKNEGIIDESNS